MICVKKSLMFVYLYACFFGYLSYFDFVEKSSRADAGKDVEQHVRRKSIEFEDPSIVAFGKSVDSRSKSQGKDGNRGKEGDNEEAERQKNNEGFKNDKLIDEGDRKKRTKVRAVANKMFSFTLPPGHSVFILSLYIYCR